MLIFRFVLLVLVSARINLLPCGVQKGIYFSHSVFCCSISIHSLSGRLSLAPALMCQLSPVIAGITHCVSASALPTIARWGRGSGT